MIDHKCECGAHYRLQDELSGQEVQCYKCGRISMVESGEALPAEQAIPAEELSPPSESIPAEPSQTQSAETPAIELPALSSIGEIYRKTWEIYTRRFTTFYGVNLWAFVHYIVLFMINFLMTCLLVYIFIKRILHNPYIGIIIAFLFIFAFFFALIYISARASVAHFIGVTDDNMSAFSAYKRAGKRIFEFIWCLVLAGTTVLGGFLLGIIPGVIFSVWFFLAPFVLASENLTGMDALMKSREYVRGRWWGVLLRLLAGWAVFILLLIIPVIGQILAYPFSFIYSYILYQELKTLNRGMEFHPKAKTKNAILATGALGFALPVILMFVLVTMFLKSPAMMMKINSLTKYKFGQSQSSKNPEDVFVFHNSGAVKETLVYDSVQKKFVNKKAPAPPVIPAVSIKQAPAPVVASKPQVSASVASKPQVNKPPRPPAPVRVRVVTSDGSPFSGILVDKDDVLITLKSGDGEIINLPIDELVSINGRNPGAFLKNFTPVKEQSGDRNPMQ